ncbi:MAG: hypothetical protein GEU82_03175 [Luteitalea sp.]|nr:hypothetical protein [Luteitalea sp.]
MATIGLIGAGSIGSQLARLAVAHSHDVVISNSRGPETLTALVTAQFDERPRLTDDRRRCGTTTRIPHAIRVAADAKPSRELRLGEASASRMLRSSHTLLTAARRSAMHLHRLWVSNCQFSR